MTLACSRPKGTPVARGGIHGTSLRLSLVQRKLETMKLVIAIIRPETLEAVQGALNEPEMCLMSVSQVLGDGRDPGYTEIYRGRKVQVQRPKVRVEVAVNDLFVEAAVKAIVRAGCSGNPGQPGDGKVFVVQMDQCVPIGTGERQRMAMGAL